jgi:hypothetical protein
MGSSVVLRWPASGIFQLEWQFFEFFFIYSGLSLAFATQIGFILYDFLMKPFS